MRYGICTDPENLTRVAKAGFDYVECALSSLANLPEEDHLRLRRQAEASPVKIEATNIFFPGHLRIVGPEADWAAIKAYVCHAMGRAADLGVKTVVVGSGGARRIPDGMDEAAARRQLIDTLRLIGDEGVASGITVALEPLNNKETNLILSVSEGAALVKEAGHPQVRLLADFYHMRMEREPMSALLEAGGLLAHVHLANSHGRVYPLHASEEPYDVFFAMLRRIGYQGRISIEAGTTQMETDAVRALAMMKKLETEEASPVE